jgi:hypothetical protein
MKFFPSWKAPTEMKIVATLLVGIGVVFVLLGLLMVTRGLEWSLLKVPIISLVAGGLAVAGLCTRKSAFRIAAIVVSTVFGVFYAFLLVGSMVVFVKLFAIPATVGYVYSVVLLNSAPVRRFMSGEMG